MVYMVGIDQRNFAAKVNRDETTFEILWWVCTYGFSCTTNLRKYREVKGTESEHIIK